MGTKEYHKIKSHEHYLKNKESYRGRTKIRRDEIHRWLLEIRSKVNCVVCGFEGSKCPVCIDFHHKDPNSKDNTVAKLANELRGKKRVLKEIEKCVPLCANCHRMLTHGYITLQ